MCGRYFLTVSGGEIRQRFRCINEIPWQRRWNIAPGQPVPIVIQKQRRVLESARWGLVPSWCGHERISQRLINARVETLAERPAFRDAFRKRRCLVPAVGFYEWQPIDRGKQPYAIRRRDGDLMAFAGLWERWQNPDTGTILVTCVIVTTAANHILQPLHRRMPAILEESEWDSWIDAATLPPRLGPCRDELLKIWPVTTHVNATCHDDPHCLEPLHRTQALFS